MLKTFIRKVDLFCLKWTVHNGGRRVCKSYQTDTDEINIVVNQHRNNKYLKVSEFELKVTGYEKLHSERLYLLN